MLYLGIDQHKRRLTMHLRSEDGSVILKRQVSTQWEKVRTLFANLAEKAAGTQVGLSSLTPDIRLESQPYS